MSGLMKHTDSCTSCMHSRGAHLAPEGCTVEGCSCIRYAGETVHSLSKCEIKSESRFPLPEGAEPLWAFDDIIAVYQPMPEALTVTTRDLPGRKEVVVQWKDGGTVKFRRVDRYAEVCANCDIEQVKDTLLLGVCERCRENPNWMDEDEDFWEPDE